MLVNQKIFKAYDVRGIYPEDIDEDAAYKIGAAFAIFLEGKKQLNSRKIIVGRDMRVSSPDLFEALSEGIISKGVDVIDIGQASTPFFYWCVNKLGADAGAMITASHNPSQYNGIKMCDGETKAIGLDTGLKTIQEIISREKEEEISLNPGKMNKANLIQEYINFIAQKENLADIRPLKIVADCGNGMIGPELELLIKRLPCQFQILFGDPDGNFPNHEANPAKAETLVGLKKAVLDQKADLGLAFDGDGDRIGFIDEKGESIRADFIGTLIAKEILRKSPGEKILYDVRSSRILPEIIKENGGVSILEKAGYAFIKVKMRQDNIAFGCELSGHYFFREFNFNDNSLLAMIKVLGALSREQKPLSELVAPFKKYFSPGEINFEVPDADKALADLENHFSDGQIKKVDGLTVEYPNWWFNIRKSNTEPVVRLNLEADTNELMEEKEKELRQLIGSY